MPKSEDLRLIGIRVDARSGRVLGLAAAAYDVSVQELLRPVLEGEAARLAAIPEIARIVDAARELQARNVPKVTQLDRSHRARGGDPS